MTTPEKSSSLLAGRRAIDGVNGVELLGDYEWFESVSRWALPLRITIDALAGQPFEKTDWYIVVDDAYPWGSLKVFPAANGGIQSTYPHQNLNKPRSDGLPWRTGDVCLISPMRLHGGGYDTQAPAGSDLRLLWHIGRLSEWITAAASGTLNQPGDQFELPPFPGVWLNKGLVYSEGDDTFESWKGIPQRYGKCTALVARYSKDVVAIGSWSTLDDRVLRQSDWGTAFVTPTSTVPLYWIRLNAVPIHRDWAPPLTWKELRSAAEVQGLDLEALLEPIIAATLGKGGVTVLVGFPMPKRFGEADCEMCWLALDIPKDKGKVPNGFRKNPAGYWMGYMRNVVGQKAIEWRPTANWHPLRLAARGQLAEPLRELNVTVVGVGALGSVVTELLARGGVQHLAIIDSGILEAGNLTRHVLRMSDIGRWKTEALRDIVVGVSPHVQLHSIHRDFRLDDAACVQAVQAADLVIDCTGDDRAFVALSQVTAEANGTLWVSASLSHGADSMYVFASPPARFSFESYLDLGSGWFDEQQDKLANGGVVFEGPGCWHPAFPGRNDDIRLLAATLPRVLEGLISSPRQERVGFVGRIDISPNGSPTVTLTTIEETP